MGTPDRKQVGLKALGHIVKAGGSAVAGVAALLLASHSQHQFSNPVQDGLALLNPRAANAQRAQHPRKRANLRKIYEPYIRDFTQAAGQCLPHRASRQLLQQDQAA